MATVTKPIALDESIHTTEQTPRNIADVLAEELARIAENILPPNAEDITYDNTESGLTATNVQDAIDEVVSKQADVIADTMADLTENKTAVITDGVADFETIDGSLVKSLVVSIEPSQSGSGTPSPSNIRPISGYTQEDVTVVGKNIEGFETGTYNSTNGAKLDVGQENRARSISIKMYRAGTYHFKVFNGSKPVRFFYILWANDSYGNNTRINSPTWKDNDTSFTLASDAYMSLVLGYTDDSDITDFDNLQIQLEQGSTATTFEPYHGKTYTTPFNQTVYGGTLDVLSGELTITHGMVDLGSLTWGYDSTSLRFETASLAGQYKYLGSRLTPFLSSMYVALYHGESFDINWNYVVYSGGSNQNIIVHNHDYTSASDFKTAMDGVQLVYELATPTTISLTPQTVKSLVGENHISASTGDVTECKFSMMINGDDLAQIIGG